MRWVEMTVAATASSADAVTGIMIDEGCGGTAVHGSSASVSDEVSVIGYLPVDDRLEARLSRISERIRRLPELGLDLVSDELVLKWVEDSDWADGWKQFFKPLHVGKIVVKPSWEDYQAQPGELIVQIDPGMAFGTGNHDTTQLCLEALQELIRGGETVLDVGTGSGILAIAAAKLGAGRVVGLDIDSVAVEVAINNVADEGLNDILTIKRADSPEVFDGTADVVVANIIASVIIGMARELREKTRVGGVLVVSGIILERAQEVIERLEQVGMRLMSTMQRGEWAAILFTRDK